MSEMDALVKQSSEWLRATGPDNDVVVSSRIRLARNLKDYHFQVKLKPDERAAIVDSVGKAVTESKSLKDVRYWRFSKMDELDKQLLVERHLVSREHAAEKEEHAVAVASNEVVSLMVLEEDHLRLQIFQSGLNLHETWRIATGIDDELESKLDYAFSPTLGYLTACPTNVGTGLRASCMLHLPSLVMTKQASKVLQALSKLNLAARGLYGEGTQATGNFFQISNQMTLGQQEEEILDNLESVIRQIVEHEKEARQYLKSKRKARFEDQIWRALGTLKSARVISSAEATQLLSLIELGVLMEIFGGALDRKDLNSLFLLVQPAHLQKLTGKTLNSPERDVKRADLIRKHLEKLSI